jgi:REP element-mobilizing transposase RayT
LQNQSGKFVAQSLSNILIHIIFSTKKRTPFIKSDVEKDLYSYIVGIAKEYGSHVYEIGGVEDHIHILASLSRTITISKLIEELKKGSSKWMKTKGAQYFDFSWQHGYCALSIGYSGLGALRKYIQNQKEHHKKTFFQDEIRQFLNKYQIPFDEKYIWE